MVAIQLAGAILGAQGIELLTMIVVAVIVIAVIAKVARAALHIVFVIGAFIVLMHVLGLWDYVARIFQAIAG